MLNETKINFKAVFSHKQIHTASESKIHKLLITSLKNNI